MAWDRQRMKAAAIEVAKVVAVAAAYFLSAKAGRWFAWVHGYVAPIWPPTGIAIAAVVVFGRRIWPGIALGSLALTLTRPAPPFFLLSMTAANVSEALLADWVLRRVRFQRDLAHLPSAAMWGLAIAAGAALSATIGVLQISAAFGNLDRFW